MATIENLVQFLKTIAGQADSPEDIIEIAMSGEPPHESCTCIKCSVARGEMPSAPTDPAEVTQIIVDAMQQMRRLARKAAEVGHEEIKELVATPRPARVEEIVLEHWAECANASVKASRLLNELLAPEDRLPARLIPPPITAGEAVSDLMSARAKLQARLRASIEARRAKQAAKAEDGVAS